MSEPEGHGVTSEAGAEGDAKVVGGGERGTSDEGRRRSEVGTGRRAGPRRRAGDTVTASVHINAPPERVYEYFTRPEAIVSWMGDYALLEAQPGGRFDLDIRGAPVRGRYLHLDPPHRLLISWGYAGSDRLPPGASTVEVRLTADRGGTRVELEHRDLPPPERPGHASGWTHYLARLQVAGSGRAPGPDPGMPDPAGPGLQTPDERRRRPGP